MVPKLARMLLGLGMDYIAHVPRDMAGLLPQFLANRRTDAARLRSALESKDWGKLQIFSERMYAVGNPYGFRQITTFGRQLRQACEAHEEGVIQGILDEYEEYLTKVQIIHVETAIPRPQWGAARTSDIVST